MATTRTMSALLNNYQDFDMGRLRQKLDQAKSEQRIVRPVERYSYALMRAALNVFVNHNFAETLNCLAFGVDGFEEQVRAYVPQVWSYYLDEAQETLATASIKPLSELKFKDWGPGGDNVFGAWHRMRFPEFDVDALWVISNKNRRLGGFDGLCYLDTDEHPLFALPRDHAQTCARLGSLHLHTVTDEMLEALGIPPESAISAIKWQMQ